ncbi:zinc finger MYM-type protein 1-like [Zingiber officinale]|uniref:zinc finger MYM-type protein 1-like n=1 Tax=Zingiber officinale TaxID=94328 RepID=UPI001C4D8192|nr:zinc finger MYM-type protein 1-like [Zingiber officinale]
MARVERVEQGRLARPVIGSYGRHGQPLAPAAGHDQPLAPQSAAASRWLPRPTAASRWLPQSGTASSRGRPWPPTVASERHDISRAASARRNLPRRPTQGATSCARTMATAGGWVSMIMFLKYYVDDKLGEITMLRYFKKIRDEPTSNKSSPPPPPPPPPPPLPAPLDADSNEYPSDPGLRKHILKYNVNEREIVRRYYLQKGPFQPKNHEFPWRSCPKEKRRFRAIWFSLHPNWLEYSIAKDATFCLYCYLFKADHGGQSGGDSFVTEGFKNWRKKEKFNEHVGNQSSIHNRCMMAAYDLMNQKQHIETCLVNQSSQVAIDYRVCLTASIDCIRFLVRQGLAFRGHDESTNSLNHGNFLELLRFLADHNEDINRVPLDNAPSNLKLTSPDIQKDIIRSIAYLTTNSILGDLGDELFTILVDEARDISVKEQMALLYDLLSISNLRGQGYDGASNMKGEFNSLKSLIMMENPSAYYVHYFAHQLQLTLVAVVENHIRISTFFDVAAQLNNIVGASCKRRDILREKQFEKVIKGICNCDIFTGQEEGKDHKQRAQANNLLELIRKYEFIFQMHLMKNILGVTNDLSQALQRKDQDIVNAMILARSSKHQLQTMKDDGWDLLLNEVSLFCVKYEVVTPRMEDLFVFHGRSRRNIEGRTNLHYYRVETFYEVIDLQLQELNSRFNEVNTELLLCMSCLDPSNSFSAYDKRKLLQFAQFYPSDFSPIELMHLEPQLDNFIFDMRSSNQFSEVVGISQLAKRMVQLKKHRLYPLVYLLLKLALLLPVATATVERVFSAMKIIKTSLQNQLGDDMVNDCLIPYIERDVFDTIDNEAIIQHFQNMKSRRVIL